MSSINMLCNNINIIILCNCLFFLEIKTIVCVFYNKEVNVILSKIILPP